MSLHEERVPYETIKAWVLEAYFDFCRDRGVVSGLPHAEMLGAVSYEYEECFERPIECLMLEVVYMILNGGWYEESMTCHRKKIQSLIAEHGLGSLLATVPVEEAKIFQHDLKALKLI
ncbi:hypothetical protein [Pseudomonas gingeri]|uniref:Uncharacterized protein n=1 Tax=Pseudomonas gingeri TaxID=117681 RepID=A0A7Y7WKQ1_9PSED|nr:hypothetical protein [Pseudomonas gingeri]NWB51292.1 hypothetical protein [Pseudomonas gingeri]